MERLFTEITFYIKNNGQVRLKAKYETKDNRRSIKEVDVPVEAGETENIVAGVNGLLNEMGIK